MSLYGIIAPIRLDYQAQTETIGAYRVCVRRAVRLSVHHSVQKYLPLRASTFERNVTGSNERFRCVDVPLVMFWCELGQNCQKLQT